MTIVEMLEKSAKLYPEKTAIICKGSRISYRELGERSRALAGFLAEIGLRKGDRVGFLLEKTPEVIISFLGVASAGGSVFPIDYNQTLDHIQYVLDLTRPAVLVVGEQFQSMLSMLKPSCADQKIIMIGEKARNEYHRFLQNSERSHRSATLHDSMIRFPQVLEGRVPPRPCARDILQHSNEYYIWEEIFAQGILNSPDIEVRDDDVVYLNFTSGTTGIPKAAITTHANIYWNTLSSVESLKLTHDDVHLCMFPVFGHPHELFARPLFLGGTIVLIDNISPKAIVRAIWDHGVTCMMATASIYLSLVRYYGSHSLNLNSLRIAESGGMHTSSTLVQNFRESFKVPIVPVWGSTETTGISLASPVDGLYRPNSMGKPCPYCEIKIVGEDGKELDPVEIGEMAIKGPAVCSGYYGNPEETAKHMRNDWFFTGDLAKKDSDNYFYFAGRKSRMMKVAGLKVFPCEIEEVLNGHPDIAEAAVIKVPDRSRGEAPKAVIVLKGDAGIGKSEIREYCKRRMSRYKVPRVIEFRNELPKSPSGKILYRRLEGMVNG